MRAESAHRKDSAREVALQVLCDVFGAQRRSAQASYDVRARRAGLDSRDRAFAAELAYGAIKQRRLLDWYLQPYLAGRAQPLPATIAEIVRLGVYQLRFMGSVDDHAAVYETVNLARRHGHKGTAGLVNAVLRRFIADAPAPPHPSDFANRDDFLGTAYSVPTWLVAHWERTFDGAREAVLAGINLAPQHAIRPNALRAQAASVRRHLEAAGFVVQPSPFAVDAFVVTGPPLADDANGRWSVQSETACMPVDLLAPQPGETVLELCSGRGNKSVQLAARMSARGALVCVELDSRKTRVLRETLARGGVANAAIVEGDAREAAADLRADAVLLDAPCSGLGILGRHPEARWRKSPDDPPRLARTQAALLRAAAARTRPGGRLVYSVCTTDPREGVELVDAFLAEAPDFSRAPLPERYAPFVRATAGPDAGSDVLVPPGIEGRDGFHIAVLSRAQ